MVREENSRQVSCVGPHETSVESFMTKDFLTSGNRAPRILKLKKLTDLILFSILT